MLPHIIMSSVDANRVELLLETLAPGHRTHADALLNEIARAEIVDPWDMPPRIVTMNSTVRFVLRGTEGEWRRTLVYPKDAAGADALSILSPVGGAMLGLAEGDAIGWTGPDGRHITVEVLEVAYQPERAGDFHL
jgi:regulator of nucleoside diphosphate kinase